MNECECIDCEVCDSTGKEDESGDLCRECEGTGFSDICANCCDEMEGEELAEAE